MVVEDGVKLLTANSALYHNGLCSGTSHAHSIVTSNKRFHKITTPHVSFFYRPVLDMTNYVRKSRDSAYLIPSAERAIVEGIKYEDTDIGLLMDSIEQYVEITRTLVRCTM